MAGPFVSTAAWKKAQRRFYPKRDGAANSMARLTWALNFAQAPIEDFTPGQKLDAQTALSVFPGAWPDFREKDQNLVFSEPELLEAHQKLSAMFHDWLSKQVVYVNPTPPGWQIFNSTQHGPDLEFMRVEHISKVQHLIARIAVLLVFFGDRIKRCPAPAKRGKGAVCDRLFAGSHKKEFCSQRCQLRAGKQTSRARAKT